MRWRSRATQRDVGFFEDGFVTFGFRRKVGVSRLLWFGNGIESGPQPMGTIHSWGDKLWIKPKLCLFDAVLPCVQFRGTNE